MDRTVLSINLNARTTLRLAELVMGLAAAVVGLTALYNLLFGPTFVIVRQTGRVPGSLFDELHNTGTFPALLVGFGIVFAVIAISALAHTASGRNASRIVLWLATLTLVALTAIWYFDAGLFFVPGAALALAACVLSLTWKRAASR
ncbi:MAG: hypothetical protein OJF49_002383 [Ktedonobacterales bacterium]|jgi:hypothetical protein|nr:MAG: hypothetical protein OJF49_002383 [Ktedonobacterales bacterium]